MKNNILIVDDEFRIRKILELLFKKENFLVETAQSGEKAIKKAYSSSFQIILLDMNMEGMNGLETMEKLQAIQKNAQYIFVTAHGTIQDAVKAIQNGAYNFVTKPFDNDELIGIVKGALRVYDLNNKIEALRSQVFHDNPFKNIIGNSKILLKSLKMTEKVAKSDITVLVRGESGTGKELIVRAIHKISERKDEKFIAINCAAIPKDLFESEFFGHKKGAFTGAINNKNGKFSEANNGTIFLDEIGEIPLEFQAKLLRVLENGEINPVGSTKNIQVNLRVIAATNKNLLEEVKKGNFRKDLYYRLNVFEIILPSLKERKDDIKLLAHYFLKKKFPKMKISDSAIKCLRNYSWPGNIRQLKNEIERAAILADDFILPKDFSFTDKLENNNELPEIDEKFDLEKVVNTIQKNYFEKALQKTNGNKKKAAKLLGISYRSFNYQLEKLNS